jgi:AcrR family transcriptional regulator
MSGTRALQAESTRRALIDAAAQLFAQKGYTATSVAAIGDAAGLSRGIVNFHFATKEKLLHAVIEQLVAELEAEMFPAGEVTQPLAALAELINAHRHWLTDHEDRARLLFRLQAEALDPRFGIDAFAELHARWLVRTRPWWDLLVSDGLVDSALDHDAVTTFVIGSLRGIALEWLLSPEINVTGAYDQLLRSLPAVLVPPG